MKRILLLAVLILALPGSAYCTVSGEASVRAAFLRYDRAWRDFDTEEVLAALAPDVEWTNSIGLTYHGTAEMRGFLNHLFKNPKFLAGKSGPLTIHAIRMLGSDVAVVSSSESTFGQIDFHTGKPVREQRTNELTVLQKRDGRWLVVNDISSDESHGI